MKLPGNFLRSIAADVFNLQRHETLSYQYILDFVTMFVAGSDWTPEDIFRRPVNISAILDYAEENYYNNH